MAPLRYPLAPSGSADDTPDSVGADKPKGWFRGAVPATVLCLIFLLTMEAVVVDSFVLRTSSMEPTVVGRPEDGDRVLMSRTRGTGRAPRRWEVLLFRYPNNGTVRYMKRLVGLGGEQLFIRGGDIWVTDSSWFGSLEEARLRGRAVVLRKPEGTARALLDAHPVLTAAELEDLDDARWQQHFEVAEGPAEAWALEDGFARMKGTGLNMMRVRREARNVIHDVTRPQRELTTSRPVSSSAHQVGDLELTMEVRPRTGSGPLTLVMEDAVAGVTARAVISVDGAEGPSRVELDDRVLGTSDRRLKVGTWTSVRFSNVDDRLRLELDGETVCARDYGHPAPGPGAANVRRSVGPTASRVLFGARDGDLDLRPVSLHRDIHYVAGGQDRFLIPEGHLVFLGDNTPSSSDSRSWRRTAIRVRDTGALLEGDSMGVTSASFSLRGDNPWREADGSWTFTDRSGHQHRFEDRSQWLKVATWRTPYVPQDQVLGRAVAVMWPLDRGRALR